MNFIGRHTPLDWVETSFLVDGRAWYTYTTQDPVDGAFLEVAVRQANPLRHGQCDWAWTCRVDGYVFSYGTHHGRDDRAINVARCAMKEVVIARVQSRKWKAFQAQQQTKGGTK